MYAVFTEVNADEAHTEDARKTLSEVVAPRARERGAKGGYWLAPGGGRGVSVVVFDTEEQARGLADQLKVGQPPAPEAPPGVTVKNVEVREVIASVS
jgi:hypothetical protein